MLGQNTDLHRLGVHMEAKLRRHWRKSSQWFALTRKHAELVAENTELQDIFQQHCKSAFDSDLNGRASLQPACNCSSSRGCVGRSADASCATAPVSACHQQCVSSGLPTKLAQLHRWQQCAG